MIQKLGIALITVLTAGTATIVPAAALDTTDGVDAVSPAPQVTDVDGDGLAPVEVTLPLSPDSRVLDLVDDHDHGHGARVLASGTASLSGAPQMVILQDVPADTHLAVRSRNDGRWSAWTEVVATPDEAPDAADRTAPGVGPIWIGDASERLEIALLEGAVTEVSVVALRALAEPDQAPVGYAAATSETTTSTTTTSTTTPATGSTDDGEGEAATGGSSSATLSAAGSFIRPRRDWATDAMAWNPDCTKPPQEADELRAMVVHHTAGTNDYTEADVVKVIRGIWYYHVKTRGWCDVAYNFVADKYGGIWEGRQGGVTKAIIGGHTYGFNTGTTSVAQLGNYQSARTPGELTSATRRLIGWKLGLHGIDPSGQTTVTNRTGSTFRGTPAGGEVPVPTVAGHRDLGSTTCPGDHTYETLPSLRAQSELGVHLVAMHETFLQAPPTPAQYRRWLDVADEKGLHAAGLGMARSEAYSGLIIDDLYERVLGRAAEPAGKAYWLGVLASGVRVEEVGAHFYGSDEYVDAAGSSEAYVELLYDNLLFRAPEPGGLGYWSGLLDDGVPAPAVTRGFYRSLESRRDRVTRLYDRILGRAPDKAGREYWAEQLIETDDVLLAVELSVSDEFYDRATR